MRARVQNGSFIPPSPVVPEKQDDVSSYMAMPSTPRYVAPQQATPAPAYHAPQPTVAPQSVPQNTAQTTAPATNVDPAAQGLVLRPPVPAGSQVVDTTERRRTPSLLERITGAYGNMMNSDEREETTTETTSGESSAVSTSGLRAEKNVDAPSQGQLNIDSPAAPAKEDDLDIPAFLRRQAN